MLSEPSAEAPLKLAVARAESAKQGFAKSGIRHLQHLEDLLHPVDAHARFSLGLRAWATGCGGIGRGERRALLLSWQRGSVLAHVLSCSCLRLLLMAWS